MDPYTLAGEMLAAIPPQQTPTAPGTSLTGTVTVSAVAVLLLSFRVWYVQKHDKAQWSHLITAVLLGLVAGTTALGGMGQQLVATGVTAIANIVGSV